MRQEQQPREDRRMDVLASVPAESGKPRNQLQTSQRADDVAPSPHQPAVPDVAALAHTLVAHLPTETTLPRALAACARLLPGARALRLFALSSGETGPLTLVAEVTRKSGDGAGGSVVAHDVARESATLGLGDEAETRTLRERAIYRGNGVQALPLVAASGTLVGVLIVEDESRSRADAALLPLCADSLAVLLDRLRQERTSARVERALVALPGLSAADDADDADDADAELSVSRRALDAVSTLAQAAAAVVLAPSDDGALRALPSEGDSEKGREVEEMPLGSTRSAEILAALSGLRSIATSPRESPDLWHALAPLHARLERSSGVAPARLTLLPMTAGDTTTAVLTLAHASASHDGTEWLPAAEAVVAAAAAGIRARRLRRAVAAEGQARDEFISLAGHELRSPLTSIKGYAQLLARQSRKTELPESMRRSVEAIEQQSLRMSEMVGELLDASRIQRGRLEMMLARTDLAPIVVKVVERRRAFHPLHSIELDVGGEALVGNWDALRVEQIVRDLVDNAARFSPEGGPIQVQLAREDGHAVVRVRDCGIGIAEDERERIFDYLYRTPEAQQRNLSGLGLGLYVCRHVAERMGGRLSLRETRTGDDAGSEFEVALPLA